MLEDLWRTDIQYRGQVVSSEWENVIISDISLMSQTIISVLNDISHMWAYNKPVCKARCIVWILWTYYIQLLHPVCKNKNLKCYTLSFNSSIKIILFKLPHIVTFHIIEYQNSIVLWVRGSGNWQQLFPKFTQKNNLFLIAKPVTVYLR